MQLTGMVPSWRLLPGPPGRSRRTSTSPGYLSPGPAYHPGSLLTRYMGDPTAQLPSLYLLKHTLPSLLQSPPNHRARPSPIPVEQLLQPARNPSRGSNIAPPPGGPVQGSTQPPRLQATCPVQPPRPEGNTHSPPGGPSGAAGHHAGHTGWQRLKGAATGRKTAGQPGTRGRLHSIRADALASSNTGTAASPNSNC